MLNRPKYYKQYLYLKILPRHIHRILSKNKPMIFTKKDTLNRKVGCGTPRPRNIDGYFNSELLLHFAWQSRCAG